ncbi:hypothetical protein Mmc1_1682 [Magnetococcus marinus MC-1]|uniref:Uncharacterized protein n=1 Tax=Magnetococcus marinus (strain ATCC BAA-1437 / JCM 17883 / MC-1) TaxID=156889 RepID=A0L898_MAGMM|nr:hypothetical protein [Magnetococcus marinus]ABK44191.1 hypothetical protein Mmc1_1682 [Magnetococcus marinus MC-1]
MLRTLWLFLLFSLCFMAQAQADSLPQQLQKKLLMHADLAFFPFEIQKIKGRQVEVAVLSRDRWGAVLGLAQNQPRGVNDAYAQQRHLLADAIRHEHGDGSQVLFRPLKEAQNASAFMRRYQSRRSNSGGSATLQSIFLHTDPRILAALPITVQMQGKSVIVTVLNPDRAPNSELAHKILDQKHYQRALVQLPGISAVEVQVGSQSYVTHFKAMLGQLRKNQGLQSVEQKLRDILLQS